MLTPTQPTPNPTKQAAPTEAAANANGGTGGNQPGEKSTKEADATSNTVSVEVRPGHPAAAQGLEITTRRPIFTSLTRITARPSNPLLKVTFNRHGTVSNVVLLESSGASDVDEPVVNALYRWTAKGKALSQLPPPPPPPPGQTDLEGWDESMVGISITFRVVLR